MRILLVDDDAGVVQALEAVLNTLPGNTVRTSGTGDEALAIAAELGGIDLLITDVVMEPMDGFTLRDHILAQYPATRVILISGYDLSDYPEQTQGYQLLVKPIDAGALRTAVAKEALAAPVQAEPASAPEPVAIPEPAPAPAPVAETAPEPATPAAPAPAPTPVPAAIPVAKPQPAPTAPTVPASGVRAVPTAAPKAVPAAPPAATVKATAIPRPSGVTPSPVATPAAAASTPPSAPGAPSVPAPSPSGAAPGLPTLRMTPTVKAQPIPAPNVPEAPVPGTPAARPVATPAPSSGVKPGAVPVPRSGAVQTKAVNPTAVPRASAPSTVTAAPVAAPSAAVPSSAPAPFVGTGEDLSGTMLGVYQLHRKTAEGRWGGVYAGLQTSINRPVSMEVLDTAKAADPVSQARFVADARAKAGVQHPSILAVYEAGEADDRFFYAYEYVDGQSIADLKAASQRLDEVSTLKVLRVAADGLAYFGTHHTPHTAPDASNIYLGADGEPRLGNIATQLADEQLAPQQEIQALGRVMLSVLPAIQSLSPGLRDLLKRLVQAGPQALTSWGQVLQSVKAIEPKVIPTDAAKISAHDRAAIAAVELARQQQKRSLYLNLGSLASLIILTVAAVWFFYIRKLQRIHDEQVHVPAGEFIFTNGEKVNLPDFWIDKYEVTYGQYAKFVEFLEGHPTSEYDHPQQPRGKTALMHRPPNWAIFFGRAEIGGKARSIPIDLSCPVMEVDFWDAYAYAKWKGRELPTEQEWEKAARGTKGFIYPWGDELDPKKVNSNADYNENPLAKSGQVDGFGFWNPVDKVKGDKSPFGVIGMAGNVREWTGTWDKVKKRPVVKGGSFMSSDVRLTERADLDPSAFFEAVGFRTISRTPPAAK
jgi:formylglycine-generating enzyme required for sulfatase activity/CheY-like chemotaxis protein